jgi:Cytochrome C and Quinol oxidase polypeptide I
MWIMGLVLSGLGTILGGVNFVTTILCMRAPGMTMFRMPMFTWNALLTSMLVLMAFPVLAAVSSPRPGIGLHAHPGLFRSASPAPGGSWNGSWNEGYGTPVQLAPQARSSVSSVQVKASEQGRGPLVMRRSSVRFR